MAADVFLRDRQTGTTVRCSVSSAGVQGNDFSNSASVSDSGLVAFASTASNLAGPDTNGFGDVFLYDPGTATTTLVSFNAAGTDSGNGASFDPHISADGTTIAFTSDATDLVAGGSPGGFLQIFVRQGGVTRLVSASEAGVAGDADSGNILFGGNSLSSDGRFVVFESDATNLVPGDTNGTDDVFLRDLQAGTLERVSLAWDGQQGNSDSFASTVSADGRFVSFASLATNLVPGGASTVQVYVRDRTTPTTLMLSVNAQGTPGDGGGNVPAISRDGRYVVFRSLSTNLVPNDTNGISDIFEILNPLAP
jgi:Tol biopolymer transport system component